MGFFSAFHQPDQLGLVMKKTYVRSLVNVCCFGCRESNERSRSVIQMRSNLFSNEL